MVGWIILGVLVALIVGLCLIPVGFDAGFEHDALHVSAKVMGIQLQLFPRPKGEAKKPKEEKPKEEKPPEEKKPEQPAQKKRGLPLGLNVQELLEIARAALRGMGRFGHKMKVDRFRLIFVASEPDPYYTAMTYGTVNEILSMLAPLCKKAFTCRNCEVRTGVDFLGNRMQLEFGLGMSIRIGQILGVVFGIAFAALKVVLRSRKRQKQEGKAAVAGEGTPVESVQDAATAEENAAPAEALPENGTTAPPAEEPSENHDHTETKQDVERMNPNGEQ